MSKASRRSTSISNSREQWIRDISARLLLLRQWLGLSQQEMAARLGLSVRAYREYERGRRKWHDTLFILRVSAATKVSIDWMWRGHYPGRPKSRVPFDTHGRPMRPVLRVVSRRLGTER